MKIKGVGRLKQFIKEIVFSLKSKALILAYHRVIDLPFDPQLLSVSPENLDQQLRYLKKNFNVISLLELNEAIKNKKIPHRAVVLTFDDGYFDNYQYAKDLLEYHQVPATIFIATGYINQSKEFWWDFLENVFFCNISLRNLTAGEKALLTYHSGIPEVLFEQAAQENSYDLLSKFSSWSVLDQHLNTPRVTLYKALHAFLKPLDHDSIQNILSLLNKCFGYPEFRSRHRSLSIKELMNLSQSPVIEIGAHTVNHLMIAAQPLFVQRNEIVQSKQWIENILGKKIYSFSYPFGGKHDIGSSSPTIVQNAGYHCAVANYEGVIVSNTNPFEMSRFLVRNWDASRFAQEINIWFKSRR